MSCLSRRCSIVPLVLAAALTSFTTGNAQRPSSPTQPPTRPASVVRNRSAEQHPLDRAILLGRESLQHIQANINDYQAIFAKRCRVDGVLSDLQYAHVKIRNRKISDGRLVTPMGVYLHFLKPSSVRGREIIWVEGKNDGKLIAHETGLKNLMNVRLEPDSYLAMRGQRHPITEIGIENIAAKLIQKGERDRRHGECEVKFFRNAKVGDTQCTMLEVTHPVKRPHFDFHIARVYFDDQNKLPIRYESWSWPETPGGEPVLEEEYTYLRLKTNVGLTELDFDIDNPNYRFW